MHYDFVVNFLHFASRTSHFQNLIEKRQNSLLAQKGDIDVSRSFLQLPLHEGVCGNHFGSHTKISVHYEEQVLKKDQLV